MSEATETFPKLRFPKFSNPWLEKKFGQIFSISAGGDIEHERLHKKPSDMYRYPVFANGGKEGGLQGWTDYYREEAGCITVSGRGNLGTPVARYQNFVPVVRLLVLRPKVTSDIFFFENAIRRIRFFVESTGVPQLTAPQISSYKIGFPALPEQQKIADFMGAVDERIKLLQRRRDAVARYKKGVMQRLFSQSLRFTRDDGTPFPDWEEKRLGDLVTFRSGGTPSKENAEFWGGDIPWISASSMHSDIISNSDLCVTEFGSMNGTRTAKKGSLLLLVRGSMLYNRIPAGICVRDVTFNQDVKALDPKPGASATFVLCQLRAFEHRLLSMVVGTGIGAGKLDTEDLKNFAMPIPHPDEQRKIADALCALDAKIAAVYAQVFQMQTFKKGLLQQMFV